MLWLAARLEWKNLLRERVFWIAIALFSSLVALAAAATRQELAQQARAQESSLRAERKNLEQLKRELPSDTLRVGQELLPRLAIVPNAALAPVALGQRQLQPQTVKLTTQPQSHEGAQLEAFAAATGPFDLAFLLVYLLPLLVIGASFDLLAREREQGTLALVLSQPIALTTFLLGKALTRMATLLGVTLLVTLLGALAAGAQLGSAAALGALALYTLLCACYTAFWFALALLVNAYGRSSAANALSLMVLWLGLVVIIPGLASVFVEDVKAGPSRSELVTASRDAARESQQRLKQAEGNHGKSSLSALDVLATQRELENEVAPLVRAFNERRSSEQQRIDKLRFSSPALLMNEALSDLSGHGVARQRHFEREQGRFHELLRSFFEQRLQAEAPLAAADYDAMPEYRWVEPSAQPMVIRVLSAILALTAAAAGLFAWAMRRLRSPVALG
jgi:ABC-2 type transport system permease protein